MSKAPSNEALRKTIMQLKTDAELVYERDQMLAVGTDAMCPDLVACLAEIENRGL